MVSIRGLDTEFQVVAFVDFLIFTGFDDDSSRCLW